MQEEGFDPVLSVLRRYFPDAPLLQESRSPHLFYHSLYMTRDVENEAVFSRDQTEALQDLERGLRLAVGAMGKLHPRFSLHMERIHKQNVLDRLVFAPRLATVDVVGRERNIEVVLPARDLLYRLHYGLLGEWPVPLDKPKRGKQINAVKSTRTLIEKQPSLSAQERSAKTQEKVIFTHRARHFWETFGGKEAPKRKLNPESPFAQFMAALIEAIGEDWKPAPTFSAWRRAMDS